MTFNIIQENWPGFPYPLAHATYVKAIRIQMYGLVSFILCLRACSGLKYQKKDLNENSNFNIFMCLLQTIELNQRKKVYIDGIRISQLPHEIPEHGIKIEYTPAFVVCNTVFIAPKVFYSCT